MVAVYADDLTFKGNDEKTIWSFKKDMMQSCEINDWGMQHYFLGIEVSQLEGLIFISQKKYCIWAF